MRLGGTQEIEEFSDLSPSGLDVTRVSVSDEMLELGEDLLDRVEIGAVGRQKDEVRAFGSTMARRFALVAAEVVQDYDIARQEGRGEDLLDVEEEDFAVDRPIDHPRRIDAVVAQRGDESQGLPMTVRRIGLEPSSPRPPAPQGAMLVFTQVSSMNMSRQGAIRPLMGLPSRPLSRHVRPVLLLGQQRFF